MKESKFVPIDYENWDRKEIYEGYKDIIFFETVDFDITKYMDKYRADVKFYPFMTYVISRVTNEHKEFRMAIKDGKIGYYDEVHPIYTLLRENKLFTHKVTEYNEDFVDFYKRFLEDKKLGEACNSLYADGYRPKNTVAVSTMPHTAFKGLSFAMPTESITEYIPFAAFGKFYSHNGKWYVPVSVEFFHGVNDGYHAEQYNKYVQYLLDNLEIDLSRL